MYKFLKRVKEDEKSELIVATLAGNENCSNSGCTGNNHGNCNNTNSARGCGC